MYSIIRWCIIIGNLLLTQIFISKSVLGGIEKDTAYINLFATTFTDETSTWISSNTVRGVNLGNWLVLEKWMGPSFFDTHASDAVDEWTFCEALGRESAESILSEHWATWITDNDFDNIRNYGLNLVRIPIGYWAFEQSQNFGEPFVQGQEDYLDKAIGWASQRGLKVMIDLHGAPGSQNGFDNSGRLGDANWPKWDEYVKRTRDVLQTISSKYTASQYNNVVIMIEALNEPAGFLGYLDVIKQYYFDSWGILRHPTGDSNQQSSVTITLHDAFQPLSYWNQFYPSATPNTMLDTHIYTVFSASQLAMSNSDRLEYYKSLGPSLSEAKSNIPVVVGEWSLAYANNSNDKDYMAQLYQVQTQVYEQNANGWIFWAWKTESELAWSYSDLVDQNVISINSRSSSTGISPSKRADSQDDGTVISEHVWGIFMDAVIVCLFEEVFRMMM